MKRTIVKIEHGIPLLVLLIIGYINATIMSLWGNLVSTILFAAVTVVLSVYLPFCNLVTIEEDDYE